MSGTSIENLRHCRAFLDKLVRRFYRGTFCLKYFLVSCKEINWVVSFHHTRRSPSESVGNDEHLFIASLASRITKRASLRYRGDIHHTLKRLLQLRLCGCEA